MPIKFDESRCDRNLGCPAARSCPEGALHIDTERLVPAFDPSKCTGCGTCLYNCPMGAVSES
jgi:NAD-dependent dihydropyrimidine dehydrogenase PreA subunit